MNHRWPIPHSLASLLFHNKIRFYQRFIRPSLRPLVHLLFTNQNLKYPVISKKPQNIYYIQRAQVEQIFGYKVYALKRRKLLIEREKMYGVGMHYICNRVERFSKNFQANFVIISYSFLIKLFLEHYIFLKRHLQTCAFQF